jgi:hypothetical protein
MLSLAHRILLPHLALPLAASYGVMLLEQALTATRTVINKSASLNFFIEMTFGL